MTIICELDVKYLILITILCIYGNVLIFRKFTLRYLSVKGHNVSNLLLNVSEKKKI